jgi:hypothetical protein
MSLIPLGFLGAGAKYDFELISTTLLSSTSTSVTFNSLPASKYKHLQLRIVAQGTSANANIFMTFNTDSGNNYSWHSLYGAGGSVTPDYSTSRANIATVNPVLASSYGTIFTPSIVDILDPFSTVKNKTVRSFYGRTGVNIVALDSGAWYSTSAVTSIELGITAGAMNVGSRFSLYGVRG